jgi:hypothetical protein
VSGESSELVIQTLHNHSAAIILSPASLQNQFLVTIPVMRFQTLAPVAVAFCLMIAFSTPGTGAPSTRQAALLDSPVSEAEIVAAQQFGQTLSISEWLGPMAPVALSPFFGITCLSGMSMFGGGWISQGNPLVGESSPLNNPAVFWTFLSLTILTSIPRLTKVSKPFAQAIDQLEAWSGIITMLVMKIMISSADGAESAVPVVQLGLLSVSADVVLMLAATINVFVINAVKFFFEVLIWLTPVPFLDAVFEFCNKAVCAALMALYAWSPTIAAALNAAMFLVAMIIFGWVYRREIFFRTILFDAVRTLWSSPKPSAILVVFPSVAVGSIKARSKCTIQRTADGWMLTSEPWFRRAVHVSLSESGRPFLQRGLFSSSLVFSEPALELTFSRLFNGSLPQLASELGVSYSGGVAADRALKAEFS